ncbi:MAG TPA: hypothetical protein VGS13_15575 [Stellaceae bacterium]|nr:hypothetical protein [Stellaceae bacterium]
MRNLRTLLLAGVAASAIGFSGAVLAQSANTHVLTVRLPDGGLAQIRYTGDVPPHIAFSNVASVPMPALFGPDSPFAALDRISAEMDREAAAMFAQADALAAQAQSGQSTEAAARSLPPGSQSYTFVSTMSGNGVCTRSVEITARGDGAPPRVVSHSSGNCGAMPGGSGSIGLPVAPAPANRPDVVWASAQGAKPAAGLVHEIPPAQR